MSFNHTENFSISKEASNAIKGLLIVLVVLGHNSILCHVWDGCTTTEPLFIWRWLYTFHVYCFFILPFIYNKFPYRKGNIRKYATRLLYPYLWVCLICAALSLFVMGNPFKGWKNLAQAVIWGSDKLLDENMGFNFPWFLPAMFTLLLLKDFYYSAGECLKKIVVGSAVLLWVVVIVSGVKFSTLGTYVPFALVPAFRLLPLCLLCVWLSDKMDFTVKSRWWLTIVFTLLSILLWFCYHYNIRSGRIVFYFVMPIFAFLLLLSIRDYLAKSRLLVALGKMSLPIYLYHIIVFNGLLIAVKHFHCPPTLIDGVIVLLITLAVSYLGAWLTTRIPILQKCLYPHVR